MTDERMNQFTHKRKTVQSVTTKNFLTPQSCDRIRSIKTMFLK